MKRLWRSMNRDLWPRRYTAWLAAIVVGALAIFKTSDLIHSRFPVRLSEWLWLGVFWWVALSSLMEATTGIFSKMLQRRYYKRRGAGLCGKCGYDLRAATSATCPECGAWHGTAPAKRFRRES